MAKCGIITLAEQEKEQKVVEEEEEQEQKVMEGEDTNQEDDPGITNTDPVDKQISNKQIKNSDELFLEENPEEKQSFEDEDHKKMEKENIVDDDLGLAEEVRKSLGELNSKAARGESESASSGSAPQNIFDRMGNIEIADENGHAGVDQSENMKQIVNVFRQTDPAPRLNGATTSLTTAMPLIENTDAVAKSIASNNWVPKMGAEEDEPGNEKEQKMVEEEEDKDTNPKMDAEQDEPGNEEAANQIGEITFNPLPNPLKAFEQRGGITFNEYPGKIPNPNENMGQMSNKGTLESLQTSASGSQMIEKSYDENTFELSTGSIMTRKRWRGVIGEELRYKTLNNNNNVQVNNNGRRRICSWHNVGFCRRRSHCRDFHPSLVCNKINSVMMMKMMIEMMTKMMMKMMINMMIMMMKMMKMMTKMV